MAVSAGDRKIFSAWRDRAVELATWVWSHMVNRGDAWGGYWNLERRKRLGRTTTRPAVRDRGKVFLTLLILANHFRATCPEHVVGLHSTSPENTSLWGAIDIDRHGDTGDPAANRAAALAWWEILRCLGFLPLLSDSNDAGGYHLLTLFRVPVPTPRVFGFLRWLTHDYRTHGLPVRPEIFPKQARIGPGGYGNWLRLPGAHHSRPHWSRVWNGASWLEGAAAVEYLLTLQGDDASLMPAEVIAPPPRPAPVAPPPLTRPPSAAALASRILGYIARLPAGLGEGQHRDDYGFRLACFLVRDLALSSAEALPWLEIWDGRNAVPKGAVELDKFLANARAYGKNSIGCGLHQALTPCRGGRHAVRQIRVTVEA